MNKFAKRNLHALLSEQRSYGNNPNWTTVLGAISASINSAEGRGPDAMNPYEAVYGQKMDHMVMCTKDEARACWTLPQILKVSNNPEFQAYAEQSYYLLTRRMTTTAMTMTMRMATSQMDLYLTMKWRR